MIKIEFWKDKNENMIDPELFSTKAEELSKQMADDCRNSKQRENKRTQLRKFYDEVLRLDMEAKNDKENWKLILPQLHMLIAKAAYAKGRNLISENFFKFVDSSVKQVKEPKDLPVFANFFEAFMGFYRLHGPSN